MKTSRLLLALQGTYKSMQVSLFAGKTCLRTIEEVEMRASAQLIPVIDIALREQGINLKDLSYIAVDQGPGAFTSLRVTVVTANALSFATEVPLIGVNSLWALIEQVEQKKELLKTYGATVIVALLNAYNHEVYTAYRPADHLAISPSQLPTCMKIGLLLEQLSKKAAGHTVLFTGNGSEIYRDLINDTPNIKAVFEEKITEHCSSETIGLAALQQLNTGDRPVKKLSPVYLKANMSAPTQKKRVTTT